MITQRGAALTVGAVLLWLLGRLLGLPELHVVAVAAAALVAAGALAVRIGSATVVARRTPSSDRARHGEPIEVTVELRNEARVPAPVLLVSDDCHRALLPRGDDGPRFVLPGLGPGRTAVLRYGLVGSERGRYRVGPLRIRVRDPFGLAERTRRYRATDDILVYPRIEALGPGLRRGLHSGSGTSDTHRLFDTGDEFHTMRDYVTGDDLRRVHWRSTARRQKLMVRQHEQPWEAEATILCDVRAPAHGGRGRGSSLEQAVSAAASVVCHLTERAYQLRLLTDTDTKAPHVSPWSDMLDRLAEVAPSTSSSLVPALLALRGSGASGLFVAVIAPPPGDEPCERHPDIRVLLQAGRAFQSRLAIVVSPSPHATARADATAGVLRAARWRAVALPPGASLAPSWSRLSQAGRPTTAAGSAR